MGTLRVKAPVQRRNTFKVSAVAMPQNKPNTVQHQKAGYLRIGDNPARK